MTAHEVRVTAQEVPSLNLHEVYFELPVEEEVLIGEIAYRDPCVVVLK